MATTQDTWEAGLRQHLSYDPGTGLFVWIKKPHRANINAGHVAGQKTDRGYSVICFRRRKVRAHRLAWWWMRGEWPIAEIDHLDGNPMNNRIENLREASRSVNVQNQRRARRDNGQGLLGVYRYGNRGFRAQIFIGGKHTHLGVFKTAEDAHSAYLVAKRRFHEGCTI